MRRNQASAVAVTVCLVLTGCVTSDTETGGPSQEDSKLDRLFNEYLGFLFRVSPTTATALGVHDFDGEIDDLSREALAKREAGHAEFLARLEKDIDRAWLSSSARADYDILENRLSSTLFSLRRLKPYENNPRVYSTVISGSVYELLKRDFAPLDDRVAHAIARMKRLPRVVEQARENLGSPPLPHVEVAIRQNRGAEAFYDGEIANFLEGSALADEALAEGKKLAAVLREYQTWLEEVLLPRATPEWRIGQELWEEKLQYSLDSSLSGREIRERAEAEYERVREEMQEVALELWPEYFPDIEPPAGEDSRTKVIGAVMDRVADEHSTRETIVADARRTIKELREFIREQDLVSLPKPDRLQVIVMPEFQAGVSTAYLDPAPPLEPDGKSFYAIEPIPSSWSDEEVESRLREYNRHMLKILSIHEGYPGHYLQLEHSNRYPSRIRRVFGNGPMIEGWAVYTERMMVENGFGNRDLRLKLNQLKFYLRAVVNALIDQKLHFGEMTDEEALSLMIEGAFQEPNEAKGKLVRAKITSTQLSTYFVGLQEVYALRRDVEAAEGDGFSLKRFHDRFLSHGSPPVRVIRRELLGGE